MQQQRQVFSPLCSCLSMTNDAFKDFGKQTLSLCFSFCLSLSVTFLFLIFCLLSLFSLSLHLLPISMCYFFIFPYKYLNFLHFSSFMTFLSLHIATLSSFLYRSALFFFSLHSISPSDLSNNICLHTGMPTQSFFFLLYINNCTLLFCLNQTTSL